MPLQVNEWKDVILEGKYSPVVAITDHGMMAGNNEALAAIAVKSIIQHRHQGCRIFRIAVTAFAGLVICVKEPLGVNNDQHGVGAEVNFHRAGTATLGKKGDVRTFERVNKQLLINYELSRNLPRRQRVPFWNSSGRRAGSETG